MVFAPLLPPKMKMLNAESVFSAAFPRMFFLMGLPVWMTCRAARYWVVSAKLTKVRLRPPGEESIRHSGIDVLFMDETGDPFKEAGEHNGYGGEPAHAEDCVRLLRPDDPARLEKAFHEGEEGSCLRYRASAREGPRRDLYEPETIGGNEPFL